MKIISRKVFIVLALILLGACEPNEHHPYGSDVVPPGVVTVNAIINRSGGASILFSAPSDADVLYIKASFLDDRGKEREVKVSATLDSLLIEGFGSTGDFDVNLYAVDRGENLSEPVLVVISPLEPAVDLIFPTIQGEVDYGGLKVSFKNIDRAEVSLNLTMYDDEQVQWNYKESFFTSQASGSYSFRGYKGVKTRFGVYVEDRWGNLSDTAFFEVTPIPDEFLDKSLFSVFKLSGDKDFNDYGFNEKQMWDNRWSDQWNCGHTDFTPLPHYLTIDLGVNVKLSRFKLYQRGGSELYKHGNPKHFKVYGTLDVNDLPPHNPALPNDGWTLLKDCYSFKPSGLPIGQNTAEDYEYQNKGEDFEFDVENLVEIRYIRIENLETWGAQIVTVIGELSFWGEIAESNE